MTIGERDYPVGMPVVELTEEAHELLVARKREDESVSDAIVRLTGVEREVKSGFGAMDGVDGFAETVEEAREELDRDLRARGEERFDR